jgi:hypothetical protein
MTRKKSGVPRQDEFHRLAISEEDWLGLKLVACRYVTIDIWLRQAVSRGQRSLTMAWVVVFSEAVLSVVVSVQRRIYVKCRGNLRQKYWSAMIRWKRQPRCGLLGGETAEPVKA